MKLLVAGFLAVTISFSAMEAQEVRVPAEWEPHAATWMQWPGPYEAQMRGEFAEIIRVIGTYEPLHLLVSSEAERRRAQKFLADRGVPRDHVTWHVVPTDNSWMRDNGPIYLEGKAGLQLQNWGFDGWGGNFGKKVTFEHDDLVPFYVAKFLELEAADRRSYILERGNLESNGAGTLVLNWDCQDDRNPGLSRERHEQILKEALGARRILWAYGHYPDDGTTGHIDGTARFVGENTLAIADYGSSIELDLAAVAKRAGLEVVWYDGDPNWLVGNGFVAAMSSGRRAKDAELKAQLESLFPGREVHMLEAKSLQASGGGIHCVTNDQPQIAPEASEGALHGRR